MLWRVFIAVFLFFVLFVYGNYNCQAVQCLVLLTDSVFCVFCDRIYDIL